jgi:NADPH:quinone reductase-like Zn-dependent oxidoreductase
MKAWRVHAWGEPETMKLEDVSAPEPGPGDVRIRTRAAALNFFDILQVQGKYQDKPPFPFTPGAEAAGIVDAVGREVRQFAVGDAVLAFTWGGGLAETVLAQASWSFPIPHGMEFEMASAMPIVYHTSWYALRHRAALTAGEWLLVHAGASGVGMSAIQIGKALGARVIATAGSPEKLDFALAQGAEHALNYRDAVWVDEVKRITGAGADVIYDPVGGDVFDLSTKCIANHGRLLVIGFAGGRIPTIQANRILLKDMSVVGVLWGGYARRNPGYVSEAQEELAALYMAGKIRPVVGKTYPLEQAPAALRDLANRKIMGKAVLISG